ncbi:hypothetical protein HSX11_08465 [Oxalobacteraceae bacterium]|nr:hypothetical protein [Oxalobacteraceae bacterium]
MCNLNNVHRAGLGGRIPSLAAMLAGLALLPTTLTSCGGGTELALVAPYITFVFRGVNGPPDAPLQFIQLGLQSADIDQKKPRGGIESGSLSTTDAGTGAGQQLASIASGTYAGGDFDISLPSATAPLATAYSGTFSDADTIVLKPKTAGLATFTLVRVDNSFRPKMHDSKWTGKLGAGMQDWKVSFNTNPPFDEDAIELLTGSDNLGNTFSGYTLMRRIELLRSPGNTRMSGRMGPAGQTPPVSDTFAPAQTIKFDDGSSLTRD